MGEGNDQLFVMVIVSDSVKETEYGSVLVALTRLVRASAQREATSCLVRASAFARPLLG